MPTGKPKIGVVYHSAAKPLDPPKCIPAKAYERKYFVSLSQIKRLLAKKLLCALTVKRRLFVEDVPPLLK
jgi:hypothetical protein